MSLEQRIERLEKENSRLKQLILAGGLLFSCTLVMGVYQNQVKVIRSEKFELVDGKGNVRGALQTQGYGSSLLLKDSKGNVQVSVYAADNPSNNEENGSGGLTIKHKTEDKILFQIGERGEGRITVN